MKLYSFACAREVDASNPEEAKVWWVVRQAAAEAVEAVKNSRKAPGQGLVVAEFRHRLKPEEPFPPAPADQLDHQGVPILKEKTSPA